MACYHPLHAFTIGVHEKTGKPKLAIRSGKCEAIRIMHRGATRGNLIREYQEVPCGHCIGCRLDYSRQWATRCMLEAKEYEHNAFITLTYDQEHIKTVRGVDRSGEEIVEQGTLVPDDMTKFMKDLRRYWKYHFNQDNIRFYACGEYGSQTYRPHFHIIAFNLDVPDKEYLFTNGEGDKIYQSAILEKIWGKGIVSVGSVTWNSCAYVARYVMKKMKGPTAKEFYEKCGIVPEFVRMSNKPGIARKYYEENKDKIYDLDEIIITGKKGLAQVVKPSKYYDKLYDIDSPERMAEIKKRREEMAIEIMAVKLGRTNLTKEEYLQVCERNKQAQTKVLKRTTI